MAWLRVPGGEGGPASAARLAGSSCLPRAAPRSHPRKIVAPHSRNFAVPHQRSFSVLRLRSFVVPRWPRSQGSFAVPKRARSGFPRRARSHWGSFAVPASPARWPKSRPGVSPFFGWKKRICLSAGVNRNISGVDLSYLGGLLSGGGPVGKGLLAGVFERASRQHL